MGAADSDKFYVNGAKGAATKREAADSNCRGCYGWKRDAADSDNVYKREAEDAQKLLKREAEVAESIFRRKAVSNGPLACSCCHNSFAHNCCVQCGRYKNRQSQRGGR